MKSRRVIITLLAATLSAPLAYGIVSGQVSADETEKRESDTTAAIAIDEKHFPDANFREIVFSADLDCNGVLSELERNEVLYLSCEERDIRSFKGIEYFPQLINFCCYNNQITELDLSKNTNLELLECYGNQLTKLDLSHNSKLDYLDCSYNKIQKLDCSKLPNLSYLYCNGEREEGEGTGEGHGSLTSLDISGCEKMEYISVVGNKLTKLDVSHCAYLRTLSCSFNQLQKLDLSKQTNLEQLGCGFNKFTALDLSKAEKLYYLEISGSKLGSIDLSCLKNLSELHCDYAGLTSLDLSGLFKLTTVASHGNQLKTLDIGDTLISDIYDSKKLIDQGTYYEFLFEQEGEDEIVNYYLSFDKTTKLKSETNNEIVCEIDEKTFPDLNFRKFVGKQYDLNQDKKLSVTEIGRVEKMELGADPDDRSSEIKSLKGIEYFTSLCTLNVYGAKIEEFAPTRMEALSSFMYYYENYNNPDEIGPLKKLDFSGCEKLEFLSVSDCQISTLDLSKNTKLNFLSIGRLAVKTLDLSQNTGLIDLEIDNCSNLNSLKLNTGLRFLGICGEGIHTLDLSQCPNLETLRCDRLAISSLNLSQCPKLESLSCSELTISKLDLSHVPELKYLSLTNLPKIDLDLSRVPKLINLYLEDMPVTKLDLSKLGALTLVYIEGANIEKLDFSHNQEITDLTLTECGLKSVNISKLSHLENLNVVNNKLTELDISHCPKISNIQCDYNSIKSLDFNNSLTLVTLSCLCNDLKTLDLSLCPGLSFLNCSLNKNLTSLNISQNGSLMMLYCADCKLTSLKLPNTTLFELSCGGNYITDLDLSEQTQLEALDLHSMFLAKLDLTHMANLYSVDLHDNLLSEIKFNKNASFAFLDLRFNLFAKDPKISADEYSFEPQKYVAQPQNFHLVSKDEKAIYLAWNSAEYAERYEICRSNTRSGEYALVGSVTECAFSDTKIDPAQTYYYYVVGVRSLEKYEEGLGEWYSDRSEILVVGEAGDPTPTPSDDATFEEFVERLYTVALNRKSDPEGKKFWIKQVVEEGKTGADCARFFLLDAPEFMQRNLSVEDFVETLYATFFDRESDAAGKKGWVEAIKTGAKTRAEVVNDFIESTEWCNVCATYGVKSGAQWHKATKASKNATNFATRLYTCCLKRDAEQGGLSYWSLALTNLEKTGAQAAQFFFESEEFVGYNTTLNDYLNRLYTTFMDRKPAASEIEYWVGEVKAGKQNRHSILAFFAQSPEFSEICKKYGIERGQIG